MEWEVLQDLEVVLEVMLVTYKVLLLTTGLDVVDTS